MYSFSVLKTLSVAEAMENRSEVIATLETLHVNQLAELDKSGVWLPSAELAEDLSIALTEKRIILLDKLFKSASKDTMQHIKDLFSTLSTSEGFDILWDALCRRVPDEDRAA